MVCIAVSPPSITPWLYVHVAPNIANEILISSPPCLGYFYSYVLPSCYFCFPRLHCILATALTSVVSAARRKSIINKEFAVDKSRCIEPLPFLKCPS